MSGPLLIVNPAARGGRSAERSAVRAFAARGLVPEVRRTAAVGDAARIARQDPGDAPVYVLGGDGTVMEVVGALVGTGRAVGILPGGTGNQLARHLRIPLDVRRAVHALGGGGPQAIDLGRLADGRHFALTAGVGLDAALIAGASPRAKRWLGVGAYIVSGAGPVLAPRRFGIRAVADGRVIEREGALAMIANVGALMGGRLAFGPGIVPDDGWLDLCILSPRGVLDGLAIASRMVRHAFRDDRRMLCVRAREIEIVAPDGVPAQADGELLADSALRAVAVPRGAVLLAPAP